MSNPQPTLSSLKVNFIARIEAADEKDESVQIKITSSIGALLEDKGSPAAELSQAFLEHHYPELVSQL